MCSNSFIEKNKENLKAIRIINKQYLEIVLVNEKKNTIGSPSIKAINNIQ